MAYIKPADRTKLDDKTNAVLDQVGKKLGKVPNMFATLAHSPAALDAYGALAASAAKGKLTAKQREQIALAVGDANDCDYCLAAHTAIGGMLGLDANAAAQARGGRSSDPRETAILRLSQRIVETRGRVPEVELDAFKAAGHDDAMILEVLLNVVHNIYTNYTNHIAGTEVDFSPAPARRAA